MCGTSKSFLWNSPLQDTISSASILVPLESPTSKDLFQLEESEEEHHEVWGRQYRHGSLLSSVINRRAMRCGAGRVSMEAWSHLMDLFYTAHQSDESAFQRRSACYRPPLTLPLIYPHNLWPQQVLVGGTEGHYHKPGHLTEFVQSFAFFPSHLFPGCACYFNYVLL